MPPRAQVTGVPSRPVGGTRSMYDKLLRRFFEPLLLLETLGKVRSERSHTIRDTSSRRGTRRQFRDDLAFLCEYDKGGEACTAIGCENRRDATVYHVAANGNTCLKIAQFLRSVLAKLRAILPCLSNETERARKTEALTEKCIWYARPKIKKLKKLLCRHARECVVCLAGEESPANAGLKAWLQEFDRQDDPIALCRFAYESRHSSHIRHLATLDLASASHASNDDLFPSPFAQTRRYVGRLSEFIRVPQRLVDHLPRVGDLVGDRFVVQAIVPPISVQPPLSGPVDLESICLRMLGTKRDIKPRVVEGLAEMDRRYDILARMREYCESENFQPRVHCEIQVLETFYDRSLLWVDDDRYIGCSKPACFCCKLYFRYHPEIPVEPDSHEKVYHNWGPIWLKDGERDSRYEHQRDILNKMVVYFRASAHQQLLDARGPRPWHADSSTGITSEGAVGLNQEARHTEEEDYRANVDDTDVSDMSGMGSDSSAETVALGATRNTSIAHRSTVWEAPDSDDDGGAPL